MSLRSLHNDILNERAGLETQLEAIQLQRAAFQAQLENMQGEIEELEYRIWQLREPSPDRDEEE